MADLDDIPVTHEHQMWRNGKAYEYAGRLESVSRDLRIITDDGAKLDVISIQILEEVAERILKIAQKAKAGED